MYRLSWITTVVFCAFYSTAQSPHSLSLKEDCRLCHSSKSWNIDIDTFHYDHSNYDFNLLGEHLITDCIDCHTTLVFHEVENNCTSCHGDIHRNSLGDDCGRCHTSQNWLVDNIPEIHEQNGFPLEGNHFALNCISCHKSDSELFFGGLGNDCINCHLDNFFDTKNPNHIEVGFSTDCELCHDPLQAGDWETTSHFFFPLTKGHDIQDCTICHEASDYKNLSPDCFSCHTDDFNSTQKPNHLISQFSTDCTQCHTTDIDWMPARFVAHDEQFFPIYSGKHEGEWDQCVDCHTSNSDYSFFSCIDCHEHNDPNDLAGEHDDVKDYKYESTACYSCHSEGK